MLEGIEEDFSGLFISVFLVRFGKLEETIVGTMFLQMEIFSSQFIIFLQRGVFRGSHFHKIMEDRQRDVVMEKMFFEDRGIASGFHLGHLGVQDGVIDLAIGVFMLIVPGIKGLEDLGAFFFVRGRFNEGVPIGHIDFHFFAVRQGDLLWLIISDRQKAIHL